MERPPSRKGFHDSSPTSPPPPRHRIRKSTSGPLRTEQSSSSALARPRHVSASALDLSPSRSLTYPPSASTRPKGPRPVRPSPYWSHAVSSAREDASSCAGLDADSDMASGSDSGIDSEEGKAESAFDDAPLSPHAVPPPSPRMLNALLPSFEDEMELKQLVPPRRQTSSPALRPGSDHDRSTQRLLSSPKLEDGQFDDAMEDDMPTPSTPPLRIRIPRLASPRPPSSPPLRGAGQCLSPQARRGWQGTSPLLSRPLRSPPLRRGRSRGSDVLEIFITHLRRLAQPPFPAARAAAAEARASLASLLPLSYHTYDLALPALYAQLVFTTRTTPALLRILIPALPKLRRDGQNVDEPRHDQGTIDRLKQIRSGVFRIHLDSLAFAPQTAWLRPPAPRQPDQDPLTIAHSVSIGRDACLALGQSTLLATTIARLALPLSLCVNLGPTCTATIAEGRLTTLALAMSILPLWPQLATITLHNAHTLLVKGLARPALFRPGLKYRLAFGPYCHDRECECAAKSWDDMTTTLRAIFALSELAGVEKVQVVLPFNRAGSLMPPPSVTASGSAAGRRKPVPTVTAQRLAGAASGSPASAPSPLRPSTVLPPTRPAGGLMRKVTPKSLKSRASTGSLYQHAPDLTPSPSATRRDAAPSVDLPALARRLVLRGRSLPVDIDFVTVESLVGTAGSSCAVCNYPWIA